MGLSLVVLAAGVGSRYGGLKQLEAVGPAGATLMDYTIFDAVRAGFARAVFVIRPDMEEPFYAWAQGRFGRQIILGTFPLPTLKPRVTAGQHGFENRGGKLRIDILKQDTQPARPLAMRDLADRDSIQHGQTLIRFAQSGQRVQQRGFSAAICPQNHPVLAGVKLSIQPTAQGSIGNGQCQTFGIERRHVSGHEIEGTRIPEHRAKP